MLHRRALALLLVAVLALAACGGDDGGGDEAAGSSTTVAAETSTTAGAATTTTEGGQPSGVTGTYDDGRAWICRPDLADDQCRDLDVTVVAPDGSHTVEEREPAADPPVDCFYVYPTVSSDPGPNSDMVVRPDDPEAQTVVAQAAQLAQSCRVFAPIYRQVTLEGLGAGAFDIGGDLAYGDVLDAWRTYLDRWNDGRGVIVVGHSQGTGHLIRLLSEEVDDDPAAREQLVAAYLFGGAVQVPEGELVGGTFDEIPACTAAEETGCVVTWSSYPATDPPLPNAIFGRAGGDGQRALCVDAVDLLGREHASPVAPVSAPLVGGIDGTEGVETRFVGLPDAVSVACDATEGHDYLSVALVDPAGDARPLGGLVNERLGPTWGLHLVDVTVAMDDLVELARVQGEAYAG